MDMLMAGTTGLVAVVGEAAEPGFWAGVAEWWIPKLAAVLGFGFLIFVHELGHFLAAKACGVQCDRFYLGFGKAIFKRKWGETEYGIGWLPLGGYVSMLGQDDDPRKLKEETERSRLAAGKAVAVDGSDGNTAAADGNTADGNTADGEKVAAVEPELNPRSYLARPVWQRMIIIAAGVTMNLITAVLLGAWAYAIGVDQSAPQVGSLRAGGGAWEAGLDVGDQIDRIGDEAIRNYRDIGVAAVFGSSGTDANGNEISVPVTVTRAGQNDPLHLPVVLRTFPGESRPRFGTASSWTTRIAEPRSPEYLPESLRDFYKVYGGRTIVAIDVLNSADGTEDTAGIVESREIACYADLAGLCAKYPDRALRLHLATKTEKIGSADASSNTAQKDAVVVPAIPLRVPELAAMATGEDALPEATGATVFQCGVGEIERIRRGSAAEQAGLAVGDRITHIDGEPVGDALNFAETLRRRAFSENRRVVLTLLRTVTANAVENGERVAQTQESLEVPVVLDAVERFDTPLPGGMGVAPSDPFSSPALGIAFEGRLPDCFVAAEFVLPETVPGISDEKWIAMREEYAEKMVFADGASWASLVEICQHLPPGSRISLMTDEGRIGTDLTRTELPIVAAEGLFQPNHGLVFTPFVATVRATGLIDAIRCGVRETAFGAGLVFRVLGNLNKVKRDIGGPIAIFKGANDTATAGLIPFLLFLVAISANLAVLNMLPVPVLDGGHIIFLIWEAITGRRPNELVQMVLTFIGIGLLFTLMAWAIGLDILRLFGLMK